MIDIQKLNLGSRLNQISCQFEQGKLTGIIGANGAGKSSLVKAIVGITPFHQGQVIIDGMPLSNMKAKERSAKMAYLAQNTQTYWNLSVYDVIALGLPYALKKSQEQEKVQNIARYFSIDSLLQHPVHILSGGELARVHLARSCIKDAPYLFADEPIAALDPYYQIEIMEHLQSLTPKITCIVVLHHLSLAYRYCDNILLLKQGKVIANGATTSVLTQQNLATALSISAQIDENTRSIHNIQKIAKY